MSDVDQFFDLVDSSRVRRARELSNVKETFRQLSRSGQTDVAGKAVIVLSYANWEGFYNECVDCIVDLLIMRDIRVSEYCWAGLTGNLISRFLSLRDRNHSLGAQREFVESLKLTMTETFGDFDRKIAKSQSNLNFDRLSIACSFVGVVPTSLLPFRNRIDKELVGWRHAVAHGDSIDLASLQADGHVDFTSDVMLRVADMFQEAMLTAIP